MATQDRNETGGKVGTPRENLSGRHHMENQKRKAMKAAAKSVLKFQGIERFLVLYLVNGRERRSPWFYSKERARMALALMRKRYGDRNAIIYVD